MCRAGLCALLGSLILVAAAASGTAQTGAKKDAGEKPQEHGVSADVKALARGNNEFAFKLDTQFEQGQLTYMYSPFSIYIGVAMAYAGARNRIAEDMLPILHCTLPEDRFHAAFAQLIADLQKDYKEGSFQLYVANAVWVPKGLGLRKEFQEVIEKNYRAGLEELDYLHDNVAEQTINNWITDKTKGKSKELLPKGQISNRTQLALTNVIYFKARWKMQFRTEETKPGPFEVKPSESPLVPMMHGRDLRLKCFTGEGFQWLELPYEGGRFAMVVLLPQEKEKLALVEKRLTLAAFEKGLEKLSINRCDVSLPRFEARAWLDSVEILRKMRMPLDRFTGIVADKPLKISAVVHQTSITIDEMGTGAGPGPANGLRQGGQDRPFSFQANHPFLFFIRDTQTGAILFIGKVVDPRGARRVQQGGGR